MAESYVAIKDCGNPYFIYYTLLILKTVGLFLHKWKAIKYKQRGISGGWEIFLNNEFSMKITFSTHITLSEQHV